LKLFYFFILLLSFLYAIVFMHRDVIFIFISGTFIIYFSFPLTLVSKIKFLTDFLLSLVLKHLNDINMQIIDHVGQFIHVCIMAIISAVMAIYIVSDRKWTAYFFVWIVQTRTSIVNCRMRNLNCRMSIVRIPVEQLRTRLCNMNCRLSTVNCHMRNLNYRMCYVNCRLSNLRIPVEQLRTRLCNMNYPAEIFYNLQVSVNSFDIFSGYCKYLFGTKNYFISFPFLIVNTLAHSGYYIQLIENFILSFNLFFQNIMYNLNLVMGKMGQKVCPKFLMPQNVHLQSKHFLIIKSLYL
jgi:hypothetical protein